MESTVHPDRKLMVETLASPNRSSTGLMITPPPMPQMAPATEASRLTAKNRNCCMPKRPFSFYILRRFQSRSPPLEAMTFLYQ